jgi:protein PhnA
LSLEKELSSRANGVCELCGSSENLSSFGVYPSNDDADTTILVCQKCKDGLEDSSKIDEEHFRCLGDSMWSTVPAVQVVSYRVLKNLKDSAWASNLLDMIYLEPDVQEWADNEDSNDSSESTLDSNGVKLEAGDSVTIIKDLEVKGAGFTAKRGTVVKNISLTNNPTQIEGRVNGVKIVLLSCFLKKS